MIEVNPLLPSTLFWQKKGDSKAEKSTKTHFCRVKFGLSKGKNWVSIVSGFLQ